MLFIVLLLSLYVHHVLANTEIINFQAIEPSGFELPLVNVDMWPSLNHTHSESQLALVPGPLGTQLKDVCYVKPPRPSSANMLSCPHEIWVLLDLTERWSTYSKFTLRLSWPASYSADFSLQILDAEKVAAHFGFASELKQTSSPGRRVLYGRIRAVDTGVPIHTFHVPGTNPPILVPFILVLEPLYFGVLPPSVLPVLGYVVLACILASITVPKINRYLARIALQAKNELATNGKCD